MADRVGREFRSPPVIHVGCGALGKIQDVLHELGSSRAVVITDRVMGSSDWIGRIADMVTASGVSISVQADLAGEPTTSDVDAALAKIQKAKADVVIGFGGGSALDTAKTAAVLHTNTGQLADFEGYERVPEPATPVIAIPTTSGTGSEVTRGAAITDSSRDVKMLLMSKYLVPRAAIVDPAPTFSMPPHVTASTGLDALTHGIEAYVSRRRFPLTDALAIDAIDRISRFLSRAYHDPDDVEAREEMLVASLHAGLAFNNASVALIHGMSRPIGAYFHIPHGLSNAMLLPSVMEFSVEGDVSRYGCVARALGAEQRDDSAAAAMGVAIVRELATNLGVPTLREWGVEKAKFCAVMDKMAHDAISSGSPANNPRKATHADIVGLYRAVIDA